MVSSHRAKNGISEGAPRGWTRAPHFRPDGPRLRPRRLSVSASARRAFRPWVQSEGRRLLMLSSYDYLGLIGDPRIDEPPSKPFAVTVPAPAACACSPARSICITNGTEVAEFKAHHAITFSSGYLANLAVIAACSRAGPRNPGFPFSSQPRRCLPAGRVQLQRFRHNDLDSSATSWPPDPPPTVP